MIFCPSSNGLTCVDHVSLLVLTRRESLVSVRLAEGGLVSVMAITKRRNTTSLSPGIVTFNSTGHREHSFDAFPQFFGWLFLSDQVRGGELH
jgi:hypothetical protein